MRFEDLRKGSYVDYISVEGKKTRCMVVDININGRIATMRELGNQSEFYVNSKAIHVPSVHLLQNAVKDNYGIDLSYV